MQYKRGPSVIGTSPSNYARDVMANTEITIQFDMDLSKATIGGSVLLYDRFGSMVPTFISYSDKVVTVKPRNTLDSNTTYRVLVKGDKNPDSIAGDKGVGNPIGNYMLGDYEFSFVTASEYTTSGLVVNGYPSNIMVDSAKPRLRFELQKLSNHMTPVVEVQLSSTNTFEQLLWTTMVPYDDDVKENGVVPDITLSDGTYYWRVRVVNDKWSDTYQFNLSSEHGGSVVDDDEPVIDIAFPETWDMLDPNMIETYPEDNFSNVAVNIKTLTVTFDTLIPKEQLTSNTITISGRHIDEDTYYDTHDIDLREVSVYYDEDNQTTTLIITLPELGGDEDEL